MGSVHFSTNRTPPGIRKEVFINRHFQSPGGGKEYINTENGFWARNGEIFETAELLGLAIDKWLSGEMDIPEIQAEYEKTLAPYTESEEKTGIINIINQYKNERINELEGIKTK